MTIKGIENINVDFIFWYKNGVVYCLIKKVYGLFYCC